ncbi:MAG: STAS domain-containing protein [Frankiaceae bacterium]|nr:STAS domain-containing protein [Frankiaceae bacterium]
MSGPAVLRLHGDLGLAGAPSLRETLLEALRETTSKALVLDMTEVPFIDSIGVGVILGARKRLIADGRELRMAALHERVLRTLTIMGLHTIIDIYPTVEAALAEE